MIKNCMYFCEGPCDEVLIKALKEEPGFIAPGKTKVFNVITNLIPKSVLLAIKPGTVLKELSEKEQCSMPKYDFSGPEALGYDKDGNPIWHCSSSIVNDITGIIRGVFASSKKDAKIAVAYLLLCEHFQMQN